MYESRAYDTEHGDPVVVLVVTGTHDVSRLVHVMAGGPAVVEQLQAGEKVRSQVARHNGGQAAIKLLAAHGGADFTGEAWPTREELTAAKEAAAGAVAAARALGVQHRATEAHLRGQVLAAYAALLGADRYCPDLGNHGDQMADHCEVCVQAGLVRTALAALDAEVSHG